MKKFKKGFTLIELLAVIIILAIVALIAVPVILDVVEDAKESTGYSEAEIILSGINNYCAAAQMKAQLNNDESLNICADGVTTDEVSKMVNLGDAKVTRVVYTNKVIELVIEINGYTYILQSNGTFSYYEGTTEEVLLAVDSSYVNYGGNYLDSLNDVINTDDGYLVVGNSNSKTINNLTNKGTDINYDGIIVKYDSKGNIIWENNFGGSGHDYFNQVTEYDDYYLVLGKGSSNDGDFADFEIPNKYSVFIAKYDKKNGNLMDKKVILSGSTAEYQLSDIIKANDNYYLHVAGSKILDNNSGVLGHVIKYDLEFNTIWIKSYNDRYGSANLAMSLTNNNTLLFSPYFIHIDLLSFYLLFFSVPGLHLRYNCV